MYQIRVKLMCHKFRNSIKNQMKIGQKEDCRSGNYNYQGNNILITKMYTDQNN